MDEHVLSVTRKQEAKVFEGIEGDKINIVRLIMMEPGTYPSHPTLGVGLVSRYRYKDCEAIKASLANDIKRQIERFMPHLIDPQVHVTIIKNLDNSNTIQITVSSLMSSMKVLVDENTRKTLDSLI